MTGMNYVLFRSQANTLKYINNDFGQILVGVFLVLIK